MAHQTYGPVSKLASPQYAFAALSAAIVSNRQTMAATCSFYVHPLLRNGAAVPSESAMSRTCSPAALDIRPHALK